MILPLIWLSSASAATLAVLPFEGGAGAEAWNGLGTALSGMLVTDLADVPGVRLVERERVDAVLSEITLGEQGFIDPAEAARLGKGLGADFLVLGTFSVVGGTFRLDARLVNPQSGEVRQSADATGTIDTFAETEKALVEGVLSDLDVVLAEDARARLIAQVPTHRLDAFAAYGRGEALSREGRIEDAKRAYEAALAADPSFALARDAVVVLGNRVDQLALERMSAHEDDQKRRYATVLAVVPDERTKEGTKKEKPADVDRFVVRFYVQERAGLDCDAYAELAHWLERHDYRPAYPHREFKPTWQAVTAEATALGLIPQDDPGTARDWEFQLASPTQMVGSLVHYLYLFPSPVLDVPSSDDMLHTGLRCYGKAAFVDEIEALRAAIDARGLGAQTYEAADDTLTLSERLELSAIELRARTRGLSDADAARVLAMIDAHPDKDTRFRLESAARQIRLSDHLLYLDRAASLGLSEPELRMATDTWATPGAAWVNREPPHCAVLIERGAPIAASWSKMIADNEAEQRDFPARFISPSVRALTDVGCVAGAPARFATPADAATWIAAGRSRPRPDAPAGCAGYWSSVPVDVASGAWDASLDWPRAYAALVSYYSSLVVSGCVADPAVGS